MPMTSLTMSHPTGGKDRWRSPTPICLGENHAFLAFTTFEGFVAPCTFTTRRFNLGVHPGDIQYFTLKKCVKLKGCNFWEFWMGQKMPRIASTRLHIKEAIFSNIPPLRNKGLIRPYQGKPLVNKLWSWGLISGGTLGGLVDWSELLKPTNLLEFGNCQIKIATFDGRNPAPVDW